MLVEVNQLATFTYPVGKWWNGTGRNNHNGVYPDPHYGLDHAIMGNANTPVIIEKKPLTLSGLTSIDLSGVGSGFNDVADDSMIAAATKWLKDRGISNGCGEGNFCPDDNVTRGQIALFLHRMGTGTQATTNTGDNGSGGGGFDITDPKVLLIGGGVLLLLIMGMGGR